MDCVHDNVREDFGFFGYEFVGEIIEEEEDEHEVAYVSEAFIAGSVIAVCGQLAGHQTLHMLTHGGSEDTTAVLDPLIGGGGDGVTIGVKFGGEGAVGHQVGKAEC